MENIEVGVEVRLEKDFMDCIGGKLIFSISNYPSHSLEQRQFLKNIDMIKTHEKGVDFYFDHIKLDNKTEELIGEFLARLEGYFVKNTHYYATTKSIIEQFYIIIYYFLYTKENIKELHKAIEKAYFQIY